MATPRLQTATVVVPAPEGSWIDVPYARRNFFAKAPLEWHVGERSVITYAYVVHGKTMTLSFKIDHSTLAGLPTNELYLRIPGPYLPERSVANPIWIGSHATKECGYATVHRDLDVVVIFRATEERFPIEPQDFFVYGQLTFGVR